MEENIAFSLFKISLWPFISTIVLHGLFKTERFRKMHYWTKQILAGIVFGIMAIYATERGVLYEGAIINVRDASPICAGLFFGAPAGIIAGLIGGIERWFCVYWGGGYYTRVACSISTFLAGVTAALVRKYLNDDRMPTVLQSLMFAFTVEVVHMLMIFLTNLNDVKVAFLYVEACTGPMVALNTIAVTVAAMMLHIFEANSQDRVKSALPTVSDQLQGRLILVVFAGFILTQSFNYSLQDNICSEDTRSLLYLNTDDAAADVISETKRSIYTEVRNIAADTDADTTKEQLIQLMLRHDLSEINMVGEDGIIFRSSNDEFVGFDMNKSEMPSEFMKLLDSSTRYVQDLRDDCEEGKACKFAGVRTDYGFLEIGLSLKQYHDIIRDGIVSVSNNRHVGETGMIGVIDENGELMVDEEESFFNFAQIAKEIDLSETNEYEVQQHNSSYGDVYYMHAGVEGYKILAIYPRSEANFNRRLSIYLTSFMETIVFAMIFSVIYSTVRRSVVKEVIDVKEALGKIVDGDLDTVVNVRNNKEFDELSTDINTTVDKLKQLIDESEKRIESELQYARQIQRSALPSVFPPYPDRNEFDIYALMDPAKEVGGDFYDLYLLKDDILVFLVADVSGKGIPASLFMMRSKTTIKNMAENGMSVDEIFTRANDQLCEGNSEGMFVTAWMGFLDLRSGLLRFANAGHNPPLWKKKDGEYEYLKAPAGFVLAGMEGVHYKTQEITLQPGDEIFLYTDGVVEATNKDKELYGEERLLKFINSRKEDDSKALCENVFKDVQEFFKGVDQFDDITELSLRFLKKSSK